MKLVVCILAAIAVLAVLGLAASKSSYPQHQIQNADHSSTNNSSEAKNENDKPPETWSERLAFIWARTWTDPVAFFTLILAFFTGALVIISVVQIGFLIHADHIATKTAKAAEDSAKVAEKTLIATNRAWVGVPFMMLGAPLENGYPVAIQFRLVNTGKSPALGLVWSLKPRLIDYVPDASDKGPPREPNTTCDVLHPDIANGIVLWPDIGGSKSWVPEKFSSTPENKVIFDATLARSKSLILEGCIAYVTLGEPHKSWFRFFLRDIPGPSTGWQFNSDLSGNGAD